MKPLSLHQIRKAIGGKALTPIPATVPPIAAICIDTRRLEKGCLFVAIKGDKFDAHRFLRDAAGAGAIAALVDHVPAETLPNVHLIHVPDTRVALGKLARYVRQQMISKVIAVGGSNGKTSTKNLIDAALRGKLRGSISPKSFNNDIGVPLTIFPADPSQDYLVLEMGTNHHGEIKILSDMALPDIAVITNCTAEHLEGLDDLAGVRREEASIISGLNKKGLLVVNGDDDELLTLVQPYAGKRITFGFKHTNDLFATEIQCDEKGVSFLLNNNPRRRIFIPILGKHTAANALAAIAVARRMGLNEDSVIQSLAQANGPEMRLQLQHIGHLTLLNDAYNANPASMRAALETLCSLSASSRRIAVLGDMRELGQSSERFHREMGEFVATCPLDRLLCVGPLSTMIAKVAKESGMKANAISHHPDAADAAKALSAFVRPNDTILLKGSRAIHLEEIAATLETASQPARTTRRRTAS
ncbi:MAG: UDP-N-acetylmuramoyl-tripeptide--D-alanyl-D-alanine ligase [Phycisphaerales bacterium]|jgi:UDP-N-acetylmuramoyl-tripeptide--D-alanyl-D-alanine ligase|nr:UDP-N-acetylmuramoyl-tripeptide--D-alanyl-D-alanine ligase [Phycisphaerales bacterium]